MGSPWDAHGLVVIDHGIPTGFPRIAYEMSMIR